MTTCLKHYYDIENGQMDWSVYHFCGLFALVEDLLRIETMQRLERADFILRNIRKLKISVNAPVDNNEFIETLVTRARSVAFGCDLSNYLLYETALELVQAADHDFAQKWYRFAYYYYTDRIESLKTKS